MDANHLWNRERNRDKRDVREGVIPREDAVFWLDDRGCWRNAGGKFRKKKIIDHFHSSISKDENGYFLCQLKGDVFEKVYFPYEDTALFVFDITFNSAAPCSKTTLLLNTGQKLTLNPHNLYIKNHCLYSNGGRDIIKFSERALIKISECFEEISGHLYIYIDGDRRLVPED